jgi:hypothetical protein
MKMDAAGSSQMLVMIYQTIRRHIPQELNLKVGLGLAHFPYFEK